MNDYYEYLVAGLTGAFCWSAIAWAYGSIKEILYDKKVANEESWQSIGYNHGWRDCEAWIRCNYGEHGEHCDFDASVEEACAKARQHMDDTPF